MPPTDASAAPTKLLSLTYHPNTGPGQPAALTLELPEKFNGPAFFKAMVTLIIALMTGNLAGITSAIEAVIASLTA